MFLYTLQEEYAFIFIFLVLLYIYYYFYRVQSLYGLKDSNLFSCLSTILGALSVKFLVDGWLIDLAGNAL